MNISLFFINHICFIPYLQRKQHKGYYSVFHDCTDQDQSVVM